MWLALVVGFLRFVGSHIAFGFLKLKGTQTNFGFLFIEGALPVHGILTGHGTLCPCGLVGLRWLARLIQVSWLDWHAPPAWFSRKCWLAHGGWVSVTL